jgi:hypothetical protein
MAWRGVHDQICDLARIFAAPMLQQLHALPAEPLKLYTAAATYPHPTPSPSPPRPIPSRTPISTHALDNSKLLLAWKKKRWVGGEGGKGGACFVHRFQQNQKTHLSHTTAQDTRPPPRRRTVTKGHYSHAKEYIIQEGAGAVRTPQIKNGWGRGGAGGAGCSYKAQKQTVNQDTMHPVAWTWFGQPTYYLARHSKVSQNDISPPASQKRAMHRNFVALKVRFIWS